jgi:hypothetical protein
METWFRQTPHDAGTCAFPGERTEEMEFVEEWSVRPMWCSRQCLVPQALAMRAPGT